MTEPRESPSRPISLRTRVGATALTIAGVAVLGFLTLLVVSFRAGDELAVAMESFVEEERIADAMTLNVLDQLAAASALQSGFDPEVRERFESSGRRVHHQIRQYLFRDLSSEERFQLEEMAETHQLLEVAGLRAADLAVRDRTEQAEASWGGMIGYTQAFLVQLNDFLEMRAAALDALRGEQERTFRNLLLASTGLGLLIVGLTLLLSWMIHRRVARPLGELADASKRLGEGDLEVRVPTWPDRELQVLSTGFNRMAENLEKTTRKLEERNQELTAALDRLRRAQDELVRSEKMGALGRMVAGLAHELNNPLTSVIGYGQLLEERLESAPPRSPREIAELRSEILAPILGEAGRARHLVQELLHFSHQAEVKLDAVRIEEALEVVLELQESRLKRLGVALEVGPLPRRPVRGQRHLLQGIFINLINNALDALKSRGAGTLKIRSETEGKVIRLVFEDDGPGLDDPDRVFEPFFTTKAVGEGTGLGLALAHGYMEQFGGRIRAENREEGGARFILTFRTADGEAATAAPAPERGDSRSAAPENRGLRGGDPGDREAEGREDRKPPHPVRVLVVEDEEPIRNLHARLLERMEVRAHLADSARAARRILATEEVDAVLCDVKMPGESGLEFYRWLRVERPQLAAEHFLFVTGDVSDPELMALQEERPDLFLHKPFEVKEYLIRARAVFP